MLNNNRIDFASGRLGPIPCSCVASPAANVSKNMLRIMSLICYLPLFVITSGVRAQEDCVKDLGVSQIYSSLWIENFQNSGSFTGIVDYQAILQLKVNLIKRRQELEMELTELRNSHPPEKDKLKANLARAFEVIEELKRVNEDISYILASKERTERALIYRFILKANQETSSEVTKNGLCMDANGFTERVVEKARKEMQEFANRRL